jgi:hypothetical protein
VTQEEGGPCRVAAGGEGRSQSQKHMSSQHPLGVRKANGQGVTYVESTTSACCLALAEVEGAVGGTDEGAGSRSSSSSSARRSDWCLHRRGRNTPSVSHDQTGDLDAGAGTDLDQSSTRAEDEAAISCCASGLIECDDETPLSAKVVNPARVGGMIGCLAV